MPTCQDCPPALRLLSAACAVSHALWRFCLGAPAPVDAALNCSAQGPLQDVVTDIPAVANDTSSFIDNVPVRFIIQVKKYGLIFLILCITETLEPKWLTDAS